jgi:hypothetical protein
MRRAFAHNRDCLKAENDRLSKRLRKEKEEKVELKKHVERLQATIITNAQFVSSRTTREHEQSAEVNQMKISNQKQELQLKIADDKIRKLSQELQTRDKELKESRKASSVDVEESKKAVREVELLPASPVVTINSEFTPKKSTEEEGKANVLLENNRLGGLEEDHDTTVVKHEGIQIFDNSYMHVLDDISWTLTPDQDEELSRLKITYLQNNPVYHKTAPDRRNNQRGVQVGTRTRLHHVPDLLEIVNAHVRDGNDVASLAYLRLGAKYEVELGGRGQHIPPWRKNPLVSTDLSGTPTDLTIDTKSKADLPKIDMIEVE